MSCSRFRSGRVAKRKINTIRCLGSALLFASMWVASARAQEVRSSAPVAAFGPTYDVSVGYSYLLSAIPSSGQVNLFGFDAGGRADYLTQIAVVERTECKRHRMARRTIEFAERSQNAPSEGAIL